MYLSILEGYSLVNTAYVEPVDQHIHTFPFLGKAVLTGTHNLCFEQKYEKYHNFYLKTFSLFLVVKFSIYLNRRVFLMLTCDSRLFSLVI